MVTRFEALESIRQGVRRPFGAFAKTWHAACPSATTTGAASRPTCPKRDSAFPGAESSPAFVRVPEGSGRDERFVPTLEEDLRRALIESRDT